MGGKPLNEVVDKWRRSGYSWFNGFGKRQGGDSALKQDHQEKTMSLSAVSFSAPKNAGSRFNHTALLKRCFEEGIEIENGIISGTEGLPWQLSEEEVSKLASGEFSLDESDILIAGKSWGAQWMARRALRYSYGEGSKKPTLRSLQSDLAAYRDVAKVVRDNQDICDELEVTASRLVDVGCRFEGDAARFLALYRVAAVKGRPWGSWYQPDRQKVLAIANCKNFKRLPLWVKAGMARSEVEIATSERVGNIWRYENCVRAWRHTPALPKRLAERVGKMSVKARWLAAIAYEETKYSCTVDKDAFWGRLQELLAAPLRHVLISAFNARVPGWGRSRYARLIELYLGLPFEQVQLHREVDFEDCCDAIAEHGTPVQICENLYGSKKVVEAFLASTNPEAQWWAQRLALGDPDLLQQYFALEKAIPPTPEAVELLQAMGDRQALKMVGTTAYQLRGEERRVEASLVREAGSDYRHLVLKPDLSSASCWRLIYGEVTQRFRAQQDALYEQNMLRWQTR